MIKHVVMWKLKEEVDQRSKAENALQVKEMLYELKVAIEEIKSMEVGIAAVHSASNFDIVLTTAFDNWKDLEAYLHHPEHDGVREFVTKVTFDRAVVDYECDQL